MMLTHLCFDFAADTSMESRRAAVRRLLRAARAHDHPSAAPLKALLPLSTQAEFPLSDDLAPPLLKLAIASLRQHKPTRASKVRRNCARQTGKARRRRMSDALQIATVTLFVS